ncbi:MAG: bacteriohemerythrin [Treponema sp.]|jgi:hemerythrin-like metal-binding protein|nr:bacteriohemerythrin [Treponema sp.]
MKNDSITEWDERYSVGIQSIDGQHQELIRLINNFYLACKEDDEGAKTSFKLMVHGLVNYIKYHFAAEEQLLSRIKYPDIAAHSRQHTEFIRDLLERVGNFERGKVFSLKNFARYIRDWMLIHITLIDKKYATYIHFVNGQVNSQQVHNVPAVSVLGKIMADTEGPSELFLG